LEDKDENFGLRIDFIVEMSCRKGGRRRRVYVVEEGF
jgi:hypothetical protein